MKNFLALLLVFVSLPVIAVTPQFWEQASQDAFSAGDPQSISVNSDGEILLAPQLQKFYEGSDAILWKILADKKGNIYAATGNDGRVIKIDTAGKASTLLDTSELEVQTILLDKNENLYAATSPDGKIYQAKPDGTSRVFFDPDDKYIWSLTMDPAGNLYAGTGEQGKIYRIDKEGNGTLLLDSSESNITSLAWDSSEKLLAGSDRNGILYRLEPDGKSFVLFDSEVQQITSIYPSPDGSIYFAAVSSVPVMAPMNRPQMESMPQPNMTPQPQEQPQVSGNDEPEGVVTVEVTPMPQPMQMPTPSRAGASQLYRMTSDGFVETIFSSNEDQILDIVGSRDNKILISTGRKSRLIEVDLDKRSTILLKAPEEQMTSLLNIAGTIRVATANPGNVYNLVETHSSSGTFYSDVKDTQTTSTWGQIRWKGEVPSGTSLVLFTRSGNTKSPDETWSDWQSAGSDQRGSKINNPRARFIQWKADFATKDAKVTPVLRSVSIAYLQQNLRPEIQSVAVQPPGAVYRKNQSFGQEEFAGVRSTTAAPDQEPQDPQMQQSVAYDSATVGKREYRRGFRTITWSASDPNRDELQYDIFYRAEREKEWKPLASNLKEPVFALDTQTLPDGTYTIRVSANDAPSNPKDYVANNTKESQPFDVDNTAPKIEVVKTSSEGGKTILEVKATDQFSTIQDMFYAATPGEWIVLFPVDSINDSTSETYRIELDRLPSGSGTVSFKCTDRVLNTATVRHQM